MKNSILYFITSLLLVATVNGQQTTSRLDIQLNKNVLQAGDSLMITAAYTGRELANPSLATLELIIENEQGHRNRLRWPMIDGKASGALYLPDSLPRGKYTLLAGLQQRFFEVRGQIQDGRKPDNIQAMLLTKSGDWAVQEIPVAENGSFAIRNWLFEDNGILAFSGTKNNNQPLNIKISTALDSNYTPLAVAGRAFYFGNPPPAVQSTLNQAVEAPQTVFADKFTMLPAVVVRTTAKNRAEQFNEQYVSGLFKSGNEQVLNIMDDPSAIGFSNIFNYLQGRIAGLQIAPAGLGGGAARWRGEPVTFFLDEVRVSTQQIAGIPMTDIAIVKAYPAPFVGAPGSNAAVAIYTRRGGATNYLPPNSQVFKVRGYTPSSSQAGIG